MSDVAYAQDLFRKAFPVKRYGKVDAALYEAYRFLKPLIENRIDREFTMRRVRSLHEGTAHRIDGAEIDALKQAEIKELRREYNEVMGRIEHLEKVLAMESQAASGAALGARSQAASRVGAMSDSRAEAR